MKIIFTDHAKVKFKILKQHGFEINEKQVKNIIENPDTKTKGRKDRLIVQGLVDDIHVIRVICEIESNNIKVITFYPTRRERYEN
ncbi:MAG: hypothetical protein O8C66_13835 [Candidatus Methanoperedens sp.]|nr:hypothetical protein [Candidatus Methanoperedens sp.]MCZ7371580.1 hypothetical protein [Candidatus Methanoperedens sp.]